MQINRSIRGGNLLTSDEGVTGSGDSVLIKKALNCIGFLLVTLPLPGPGCSKLTTSLVYVLLNFQKLVSQISQYFLLKKCEKLLHCKSFSHLFDKTYQ